jgi:uncharacterized protein
MTARIDIPESEIGAFCQRWRIIELALFGSVLRDDFRPDSDVDVLVRFHPDARPTLFDLVRMKDELQQVLGRHVDLVSRRAIEGSRNYLRRNAILSTAEVVLERDSAYLLDILKCARLALSYVAGVTEEAFLDDVQLQDSVIRRLEIIG